MSQQDIFVVWFVFGEIDTGKWVVTPIFARLESGCIHRLFHQSEKTPKNNVHHIVC